MADGDRSHEFRSSVPGVELPGSFAEKPEVGKSMAIQSLRRFLQQRFEQHGVCRSET